MNIIVVPCPDRGAGNDPEGLGLAFHQQGPKFMLVVTLLQTLLIETEDQQSKLWSTQVSELVSYILSYSRGNNQPRIKDVYTHFFFSFGK